MDYKNEDFLKEIMSFGIVGYGSEKIISIMGIEDEKEFMNYWNDKNSDLHKSYIRGVNKSEYDIDIRLFELAKSGDMKALFQYQKRKAQNIKSM